MPTAVIRKSRFVALVLIVVGISTTAVDAQVITWIGTSSCGEWVQARRTEATKKDGGTVQEGWSLLVKKAWLLGFLSGSSSGLNKDLLKELDGESLFLWTDNYCQANPLKHLGHAGNALVAELLTKKKP
jgi:hypothetical protein